jgi:cell division protein FtsQ
LGISTSRPAEAFRSMSGRRRTLLIAAASVVLVAGGIAVSRSWAFHARRVDVSGANHLRPGHLVEVAGISKATNALWLDEAEAERRLEAEPWIASADVRVAFPLTIEIAVTERSPVAVARGDVLSLIAADGTALGAGKIPRGLPVIELGAPRSVEGVRSNPVGAARALGAMPPSLRAEVARVRVLLDGTMEVRLRGGPAVRFGTPDDARRKARTIERMLAWARAEGTVIRTLTVVSPSAPAATLAD